MSLDSMGPERNGAVGTRMTHSLSTPSGVDGTPSSHRTGGGKKLSVRVQMLDDTITIFQVQAKALAKVLFEQVCRQLNLLEADYFGLEYQESPTGTKYWLDLEKAMNRQVGLSLIDPMLRFCIKFYTPDPAQLEEEYTRYLFCLQVKRDLATGSLQCNDNTAALMASYIVQASCGDFSGEDYPDHTYLSSYRFVPQQDHTMQRRIMENHKKHVGQSPAEADLNLLETARRCELYGMKMHQAKDHDGAPLNLSVAHMGIAVFQGITRINTFSWAKIRKISFKRKRFLIKLHPEGYGCYKDTVEFFFEGRNECKNFWKKCVENHGFFRCSQVQNIPRRKARVLSRGSSFRYSGKTQKQIIEFVRDNYVKRQPFQRSQSFQREGPLHSGSRSLSRTSCNVNQSISAHPLLPIDTVEWELRSPDKNSKTPSQMKRPVVVDRHQDSPIGPSRTQTTSAQVETYQTTKYAQADYQQRAPQLDNHQDSSRSVSPGAPGTWNSPSHINNNAREADLGRARQDGHSTGLNRHLYATMSPNYTRHNPKYTTLASMGVGSQQRQLSVDRSSSLAEETSTTSRESVVLPQDTVIYQRLANNNNNNSNNNNQPNNNNQSQPPPPDVTQAHYNNTSTYSMSKSVSTATDISDDMADNIIYSDINDLYRNKQKGLSSVSVQTPPPDDEELFEGDGSDDGHEQEITSVDTTTTVIHQTMSGDLYATINRKNKTNRQKAQIPITNNELSLINGIGNDMNTHKKHFSDEFIDNSIRNYSSHNDMNRELNTFEDYYANRYADDTSDYYSQNKNLTRSTDSHIDEHYLNFSQIQSQRLLTAAEARNTQSLPRNSELSGVESLESYDSHYDTHRSMGSINNYVNTRTPVEVDYVHYTNYKANAASDVECVSSSSNYGDSPRHRKLSSEQLEFELSNANLYSTVQYKHYDSVCGDEEEEEDDDDEGGYQQAKESWQRSASCKELYDFNYDQSHAEFPSIGGEFMISERIDSLVTRYDDSRRSVYVTKNNSIDVSQDFTMPAETKVYSSSYPGTTYNTIDNKFQKQHYQFEFTGSQDDISHDSYELLEKSVDDIYYRIEQTHSNPRSRSCSMDSGNYIPSDDESVSEGGGFMKFRTPLDMKTRSAADIMDDFMMEDPRDFPREKLCVKSDGSFYKHVKAAMGSRTSSQESKSEYYESKHSKSSDSSKKSKDSVYHTDSKKSLKSKSGYNSRASSQESKEAFGIADALLTKNYEMPKTTGKKPKSLRGKYEIASSRNSSQESKSDYYDAKLASFEQSYEVPDDADGLGGRPKVKSHESLMAEIKAKETKFYDAEDKHSSTFPSNKTSQKTSHVHSISLQNVEIERNVRTFSVYNKSPDGTPSKPLMSANQVTTKTTHIWPEEIEGMSTKITEVPADRARQYRKTTDDGNIFSFDKEKIESLTGMSPDSVKENERSKKSPDYPLTPELLSEFDKQKIDSPNAVPKKTSRKEELMAKTHFEEYNPKLMIDANNPLVGALTYTHATVERTKSDPNSLANRPRLTANSRRHTLMHQKSIDLTPAESSEEEYLYKQIPSAPPMCMHGSHFEIPQHYEIPLSTNPEIPEGGFEMPTSFFAEYEKRAQKALKEDIPYVLHKRHIMNGTAPSPSSAELPKHRCPKPKSPKSPKSPRSPRIEITDVVKMDSETEDNSKFLFTQNIDLSKVDPVTLEVDKLSLNQLSASPKRDITKRIDPKMFETLSSKLSQIESDSATSSRTESLRRQQDKTPEPKPVELPYQIDPKIIRRDVIIANKKAGKVRSGMGKGKSGMGGKGKKSKTRITSFSSDDESLDSDDVFGSAEAMPTKLEFSPPQSRKEIEPILKHEYSKITAGMWARGQTMSSTEVEGSPPQCRKLSELENRYHTQRLDAPFANTTELRRISERSISIPSSDEEGNLIRKLREASAAKNFQDHIQSPIHESSVDLPDHEDNKDCAYTMISKKEASKPKDAETGQKMSASRVKLMEEMIDSSLIIRSKGHAPVLFAHARLNLSEGSAFASLQRQKATQDSPTSGRRAKSLDAPVISLHRLPPMNAFSSKDDTVGFEEEEAEVLEEKPLNRKESPEEEKAESVQSCIDAIITSHSHHSVEMSSKLSQDEVTTTVVIEDDELELLNRLKCIEKITLQGVKIKEKRKTRTKLKSGNQLILEIPKYKFEPFSSGNSSIKTSPAISRASSVESNRSRSKTDAENKPQQCTPPSKSDAKGGKRKCGQQSKESSFEDKVHRTKSQELKGIRKSNSKEKSKSLERMELKKSGSKEKKKVVETEADKAKRTERQQKLYEIAMKQTITMLSPIKDGLPAFPSAEDKISVKKEGDKIIIDTDLKSKPEDHVFISKPPRKLDASVAKVSRSFEDQKVVEKLDKANRSFEDRNKSFETDTECKSTNENTPVKKISKSQDLKQQIEGAVCHKKIEGKSKSLDKKADHQFLDIEYKAKSLDQNYVDTSPESEPCSKKKQEIVQVDVHRPKTGSSDSEPRKSTDSESKSSEERSVYHRGKSMETKLVVENMAAVKERRALSQPDGEMDMQAIITERRKLDLLKRQSLPTEDVNERGRIVLLASKEASEESLNSSEMKPNRAFVHHHVPTIECEEPSIEEDVDDDDDDERTLTFHQMQQQKSLMRLSLERSRSDETTSWQTVECDEFVGTDGSDNELKVGMIQTQSTMEDTQDIAMPEFDCITPTDMRMIITPPDKSPIREDIPELMSPNTQTLTRKKDKNKFKLNLDTSRSSDTASSFEKDATSPLRKDKQDLLPPQLSKEKSSLDEESSVSCSISKTLGLSQKITPSDIAKCQELREAIIKKMEETENASSPLKKTSPTLEKQCPVDVESGSDLDIEEKISKILQRDDHEDETSSGSQDNKSKIFKPLKDSTHKKVCRLAEQKEGGVAQKSSSPKFLNANSGDRSSLESKSSVESKGSSESKGSFETESSSGSLGKAQKRGDLGPSEQRTTFRKYPIESSTSSSTEDWVPPDKSTFEHYDLVSQSMDDLTKIGQFEKKGISPDDQKESDSSFQDDLNDFPTSFGYPEMTSNLGIGMNPVDIIGYGGSFAVGRTLSRISERSTASEKTSNEEKSDLEDLSVHEESVHEDEESVHESEKSSEHQASLSSEIHSNSNQAYVSDGDRRTSAEMPDIPCDSAAAERLSELYKTSVKNGKFTVNTIKEQEERERKIRQGMKYQKPSLAAVAAGGSQDSEDWPLPEIPFDHVPERHPERSDNTSYAERPLPKTFCWRNSTSIVSFDSENWPSPPSSALDNPIVEEIETFYLSEAQKATQVMVDSFTEVEHVDDEDEEDVFEEELSKSSEPDYAEVADLAPDVPLRDYDKSDSGQKTSVTGSPSISLILPYEETGYLMSEPKSQDQHDSPTCMSSTLGSASCLRSTFDICTSSKSSSSQPSLMQSNSPDNVIVAQPTLSPQNHSPISEDDFLLNDDVFGPGTVKIEISPDESKPSDFAQKFSRGSNNSDTSIDDMLSVSGAYMDDTVRRNLEPRRLSSGSCKKCSHSSHSEEETSSFGTDLDGTVKMGLQYKKCTHSSHSEDTSIGLSISEWSTGTNTVRQYANLSGSDSLSAVSNHSNGAKSERSNHTKSSVSSINKSTESLNDKSASLSGSKNHRFGSIDNGSDGPRYDAFSNSDTEKFSSGTKSDDTTLTLTEMVQSITEWTTSSSATLVANVDLPQNIDLRIEPKRSSIDYVPLKPPKIVKKQSPTEHHKALPSVHSKPRSRQNTPPEVYDELRKIDDVKTSSSKSTERPIKIPPKVVEVHEKPIPGKARPVPPSQPPPSNQPVPTHSSAAARQKRSSLEQMSQRYQSQDVQSENENFAEKLYTQTEKFADRYQSQEFQPFAGAPAPPAGTPTSVVKPLRDPNPFDKPLIKHHSYDDKTLSKSQIREYKTSKMKHSQSFHEHLVTTDLNKIDEENMGGSSSTTTTTTTTQNSGNNTSTDNSSPMFVRPDKLIKCSPYYSSSLSSESPPIQVVQKPPRKGSITRNVNMPKSPPSGNDTDSSLDFRQQDPKFRTRGTRKRRQIPAKKTRLDNMSLEHQESSECSEGYFPEFDSGSSESRLEYCDPNFPDFEEEMETLPEDSEDDKYKQGSAYPSTSYSTKFESFDMSENVDEMGFPKYDRLSHITNAMMYSKEASTSSVGASPVPPVKPARSKKKGLKREDSIVAKQAEQIPYTPESGESSTETRAGLSDDICYSSEDSFAAAFAGYAATAKYVQNIEIPYPDFLSDYENEPEPSTTSSVRTMYERKKVSDDELAAPPPMFAGDSSDFSEN